MKSTTGVSAVAHVNGIELAYQDFGSGSALVLLHGGFGSVEMYGPNVDLLAAGRRVIGVDLQSHGRSPAADRPMRFETMADDIAALMKELKLERAAVMGFRLAALSRCAPRSSILNSLSVSYWSRLSSREAGGIRR